MGMKRAMSWVIAIMLQLVPWSGFPTLPTAFAPQPDGAVAPKISAFFGDTFKSVQNCYDSDMENVLAEKFRAFLEGGDHGFDPLVLGYDDDDDEGEEVRIPRRGRPNASIRELSRAAYWAWSVQKIAGKTFAELEREMTSQPFSRRDGGGFNQPHAWLKYAKGKRTPTRPVKGDKSQVVQAERRYPGTRAIYDSIAWDLMYESHKKPAKRLKLTARISPFVLDRIDPKEIEEKDQYRILLTEKGIANLILIRHLDAFGVLLMQWRNLDWERLDITLIHLARTWLLYSFQSMEPFVTCRRLLTKLIHHNVVELGLLYGPYGLDPKKNLEDRVRDAYFAALLGGVAVEAPSSFFQEIFQQSQLDL